MLRTTSSLLVCLLLAALVVSVRAEAKCSAYRMTGFNADDFYTVPQNTTTLSVCTASSGNACCNPSYDQTIGIFEDPLSVSFKTIISEPRDQCRALLNDVSCLLCSPEQTSSIVIQQSSTKLLMCSSFCSTLYDACKDDYTTVEYGYAPVSEIYEEPLDFCVALFDQISSSEYAFNATFLDEGPIPCWNDLPECTEDDYYALFTQCENNQRTRIFVKKPEVQCEGGVPLPPPATVACARSCRPGQRMGPLGCQNCPRGYYSLGGAAVVTHWDSWNQVRKTIPFRTYCTRTDAYGVERVVTDVDCSWELEGFQVSSPSLNNSMSAYLETSIILLEDGVFQFIAEVDAEPHYDGLNVLVDRTSLTGLLYENRTFSTFQYDLTAGYHFIQFVYSKDVSRAVGSDAAVINRVAITNVNYASDTCDPCEPGTYAPNTASTHCLDCPLNTKQPEAHAHDCISCDPNTEYAPPGSTECLPRPACTESSVYYLYGPCQIEQTSGQPKREHRAYWVEPHICLSNELPATTWEECALCEAGQVRDSNGITCSFCPTGTYSAGNGQAQCEPCFEGTEAIPALVFDTFNDFSNGLSTKCELNCGSAGWVLHQDYITSGDAHGKSVISTLMLNQTLESDGILTFSFSLICAQGCTLAFSSDAGVGYRAYGGTLAMFGQNPTNVEMSYPITAGDHSFIWQFIKNDQEELSPTDHAVIFEIKLTHASVGGAIECSPCQPGFYSNDIEVAKCKPAPAGYYVAEHGATAPTMCEGNTITTHEGSVACSACGENVDSNAEHTECDVTCLFTDDVRGYRTEYYDLNGMARTDGEMYGPIYDQQNHTYYLNMCNEQHNQHVCFDEHQNPIETYVCQVTVVGLGEDLGDTFGIIPLRSAFTPDTLGVTVHLTGGDQCHNGTNYFDRQTYIDVLCDPTAGVGTPLPTSYDNVEVWKCVYAFKWLSLYGCPVCSENDYYTYTTECDPDTQEQTKIYAWTDNPKRCHDGIELPAPETIPCSVSSIYCGPGEYLNVTSNECVLAPAGFYSIGNGIVIDNWETLQRGFSSSGWSPIAAGQDPNYSQIQSGVDDTQLVYVHDFVTDGYVSFTCYVNTYGDSTAAFSVYVDNMLVQRVTETGYYMLDFPVPAGYHYFVFLFEGGSTLTPEYAPRLVSIHQMKILGIVYAAENPVPCPPGFAASVTADYYDDGTGVDPTVIYEGATSCVICPGNYYAHQGQVSCTPCREDEYSLRGSRSCSPKVVCSEKSYQVVYSECDASTLKQTRSYQLIQPSVCIVDGGSWVPPADEVIDCAICELGHYRDGSECSVCPAGRFWDESEQRCRKSESGNAAILTSGFFTQPSPGVELPEGFLTGCEGNCACFDCRNGWIFLGDHVSSGRNPGREIDTWLVLDLTLINPGKISFVYTVDGSIQNGLQFYIDNKLALVPYHPLKTAKETVSDEYLDFGNGTVQVSFDLDNGFHSFRWVYHQTINTDGVVTLRDIVFEGVGGATVDTQCPAGQYSPGPEASYCVDCPKGTASSRPGSTGCAVCDQDTYADTEGADHCSQCGENLSANEDGTDCETDCMFHFDDQDYDISPLNDYHGPFAMTSSNTKSIWINLCSKRSSSVICIDPAGDPINTYICQLDAHGNGVDMGHYLSVTQGARGAKAANATAETDDTPAIPHKDPAPIIFSYTEAASKRCKTTITLVCDVDNTNSSPRETTSSTSCNLQLEWPTAFACPLCDDSDYAEQESECVNGVQTVTSVRKGKCYGPAVKGDSREESCPTRYSFPLVVIISVLIVLVILAAAIIVVVMYSFKIRNQYVALVRDSEGQYEMKNIEDNDLTEDKKDVV